MTGAPVVRIEGVIVGGILKGVDLTVNRGVLMGLFGANGAGKTTLLRVIFGSVRPQKGRVVRPPRVGASWQNPYMGFYRQSVWEEVLINVGGDAGRAERVLERAGLREKKNSSPFSLSVGQARVLSIILASSWGPELLLVDEPTTGLDPVEKRRVGSLLRSIEATVIVASHDVGFLLDYADEVAVLEGGRISWKGAPSHGLEQGVLPPWG